jgi:hypothetical protein
VSAGGPGGELSDGLSVGELVPSGGGQWSGLLFDNPRLELRPFLSWSFTFAFADVSRDYGSSPVSVDLDWVPLTAASWRDLAGHDVRGRGFAEPVEASVYFFEHHRYDTIDLRVLEQRGASLYAAVRLSGDLDRLGIDALDAEAWLTFSGIIVSLSEARSAKVASTRLQEFCDIGGLMCSAGVTDGRFLFQPEG